MMSSPVETCSSVTTGEGASQRDDKIPEACDRCAGGEGGTGVPGGTLDARGPDLPRRPCCDLCAEALGSGPSPLSRCGRVQGLEWGPRDNEADSAPRPASASLRSRHEADAMRSPEVPKHLQDTLPSGPEAYSARPTQPPARRICIPKRGDQGLRTAAESAKPVTAGYAKSVRLLPPMPEIDRRPSAAPHQSPLPGWYPRPGTPHTQTRSTGSPG